MEKHYSTHYKANYIEGNVYAITGGGSGFGKAAALELLKLGGKVAIMGRRMERLEEVINEAEVLGKKENIVAYAGDVSDYEANRAFVKLAVNSFGKLDAFWANAGVMPNARLDEYEKNLAAWEKCIDINFKGTLHGICAAYEQFEKQGYGHFLATSSIHGNYPTEGAAVYAATKMAIRFMVHGLQVESPGFIKCTIINPPGIGTTKLAESVTDVSYISRLKTGGMSGANAPNIMANRQKMASGEVPEFGDNENIQYLMLNTDEMVWGVMYALNQPRGVSVSTLTMHAGNEGVML